MKSDSIPTKDITILRDLAKRINEIANEPIQEIRKKLWMCVNRLERVRPPINFHVEELCWPELLPDSCLQTNSDVCRKYERQLRRKIWEWENLNDDRIRETVIEYDVIVQDTEASLLHPPRTTTGLTGGAYHCEPILKTESDIEKIKVPELSYERKATKSNRQLAEDIFGDILKVIPAQAMWLGADSFDRFCEMYGMDRVFMDMAAKPDFIHEAMRRLTNGWITRLRFLEEYNLLVLNNGGTECYNGGFAITDELPANDFKGRVRLKDLWGFYCAQACVGVSPKMHEEFVLPYQQQGLALFGLNCIACCEPMDKKINLIKNTPNCRRVSVSEWNDFAVMAESLKKNYIYSVKPTGVHVSSPDWEPEVERAYLKDILEKSKGCVVEIVNNTVSTCRNEPHRIREWTQIAMQLAEKYV